jgi:hypothetical protein
MKEEAIDVCITAVEKFPGEREKCTQVCIDRAVCMGQFREYNTTTSSKTLSLDA